VETTNLLVYTNAIRGQDDAFNNVASTLSTKAQRLSPVRAG
jgi:hypothetical protein